MTRTEIEDGGIIDYDPAFFFAEIADSLYNYLKEKVPWKQERSRFAPFPRLTAWYADPGLTYSYSGVTHTGLEWNKTLTQVRKRIAKICPIPFNSLLCNYYRDHNDSIGLHTDAEKELGDNPVIASISLGAVRQFVLRHIKTGRKIFYDLPHGSLLIMGGTSQHHWLHGVPKSKTEAAGRINLTFREIKK